MIPKRQRFSSLLALVLLACLPLFAGGAERQPLNRVVAVVDEGVVLQSELQARIQQIRSRMNAQGTQLPPESALRERVLDQLILEQIQIQRARQMGMRIGDPVRSGIDAPIKVGSTLPLRNIPVGSVIHCVEIKPGKGAQLARSAGASVQLVAREGAYATIRLRSGEMRKVLVDCRATLGEVSNSEHSLKQLGKAGASRWRGKRPTVRGVAMNPVDHPHGGGEGRTSGGRHPVTPWGVPTKGHKTRKNKRTDKMIVRRRSAK